MKRWVVTGPTGAGKSAVTALLAARGAAVLDGDRLGHRVLDQPAVVSAVLDRFGGPCVRDGRVDRAELGRRVFADRADLAALDAIVQGPLCALMETELAALAERGLALAVLEAAVYFRLPVPPRMDLIVAVVADARTRAARLAARTGMTEGAAMERIAALSHLDGDWIRADLTIRNDAGPDELSAAVERLWAAHAPELPAPRRREGA